MSDLALVKTENQDFDLAFDGQDIVLTDSLQNCIVISLLCHAREVVQNDAMANIDAVFGGWWADALEDFSTGSLMWTLHRQKCDALAVKNAEKLASEALKWLIEDGVAKDVTVKGQQVAKNRVDIEINVLKPDGSKEDFRWQLNWEASL